LRSFDALGEGRKEERKKERVENERGERERKDRKTNLGEEKQDDFFGKRTEDLFIE
jgi:hypothetical protein